LLLQFRLQQRQTLQPLLVREEEFLNLGLFNIRVQSLDTKRPEFKVFDFDIWSLEEVLIIAL
jgi:hypothetical protein